MSAFDFKTAFDCTGWDRRTAAERIGVSLATVDRALDAGKWSGTTERLFRVALKRHVDSLVPFLAPVPGETVMVRIRAPGAALRVTVDNALRLMGAGVLTLNELGELAVRPDADGSPVALLALMHGDEGGEHG